MPPTCKTCRHEKRAEIDAAITRGDSSRLIASHYPISQRAVLRHKPHVAKAIVKAAARRGEKLGDDLFGQLSALQARSLSLLDDAEHADDGRLRAVAIALVRENLLVAQGFMKDASSGAPNEIEIHWIGKCPHCGVGENWRELDGRKVTESGRPMSFVQEAVVRTLATADVAAPAPVVAEVLPVVEPMPIVAPVPESEAAGLLESVIGETEHPAPRDVPVDIEPVAEES